MPTFRKKPVDVVIDVRSRLEYWMGHLPGAQCIPVDTLPNALATRADIPKDGRILVYCASGARSAAAASTLTGLGYRRVIDGGGLSSAREHFEA